MSQSDNPMNFVGHLTDLRRRIIYTIIVLIASLIVSFLFVQRIYHFLIRPLLGQQLVVLGPTEVIRVYLIIAFLAALVPTLPFALFQLWRFVSPGLTVKERKTTLRYIPATVIMFLAGISFGYYIIFPMLFRFLKHLASAEFVMMFTAGNYFGFMTNLVVPFGFLFEMPLVVMFLTRIGIVNPVRLSKMRRYAYLVLVIVGSMLSPPDFVSHLSVTLPMILLYEISILISRIVYRRRLREKALLEQEEVVSVQSADVEASESEETPTVSRQETPTTSKQESPVAAKPPQTVEEDKDVDPDEPLF